MIQIARKIGGPNLPFNVVNDSWLLWLVVLLRSIPKAAIATVPSVSSSIPIAVCILV